MLCVSAKTRVVRAIILVVSLNSATVAGLAQRDIYR